MYVVKLNLLSPEKKKYLKELIYGQFIRNNLEILLFIIILVGTFSLAGRFILESYFFELSSRMSVVQKKNYLLDAEIKKINEKIKIINATQEQSLPWPNLLNTIVEILPSGIYVEKIEFDMKNKDLYLGVVAKTREDLIGLENNLKSKKLIEKSVIPVSQLTKKENIQFGFKANFAKCQSCYE